MCKRICWVIFKKSRDQIVDKLVRLRRGHHELLRYRYDLKLLLISWRLSNEVKFRYISFLTLRKYHNFLTLYRRSLWKKKNKLVSRHDSARKVIYALFCNGVIHVKMQAKIFVFWVHSSSLVTLPIFILRKRCCMLFNSLCQKRKKSERRWQDQQKEDWKATSPRIHRAKFLSIDLHTKQAQNDTYQRHFKLPQISGSSKVDNSPFSGLNYTSFLPFMSGPVFWPRSCVPRLRPECTF
jgi:hypothetical protein